MTMYRDRVTVNKALDISVYFPRIVKMTRKIFRKVKNIKSGTIIPPELDIAEKDLPSDFTKIKHWRKNTMRHMISATIFVTPRSRMRLTTDTCIKVYAMKRTGNVRIQHVAEHIMLAISTVCVDRRS